MELPSTKLPFLKNSFLCSVFLGTGTSLLHASEDGDPIRDELDALRDANQALVERLEELEEQLDTSTGSTPVETESGETSPTESGSVSFHPGGGGFAIGEGPARLRILGYVQATATAFDGALDRNNDFSVRRARINFLADLFETTEIFMEFDGAPEARTALVEARLNLNIVGDALQLRAGKFTSQFSRENARSSRSIDTTERFMALNSMFLLPALDLASSGW